MLANPIGVEFLRKISMFRDFVVACLLPPQSVKLKIIPTKALTLSNVGELSWSWIQKNHIQVQQKKEKSFVLACLRLPENVEWGIFMSTSCSDKKAWCTCRFAVLHIILTCCFFALLVSVAVVVAWSPVQMNATLACEQAFRALWRRGGKRKESLQLRLCILNICIENVDAKCWLAEMTLVLTSLPLGTCFSMFVYIRARFCFSLIGGNLTAQSTGSNTGIGGGIQIPET